MKKLSVFFPILFLALLTSSPLVAQKFSIGILSGVNFTKPQGYFTSGKWEVKNGPVAGLFLNYQLTKVLSVQTEFDYTVINYTHKRYDNYGYMYYYPIPLSSNYIAPYYYYNYTEKWEYSFYRIPIYLKLSTPTKLKLELAIGGYYGFRDSYEVPVYPYYPMYLDAIPTDLMANNSSEIPPKRDAGFFYSVGLAYPVAENFNVYLNGRYFSGKRTYIESDAATNGAAELTFGLGYSGIFKSKNKVATEKPVSDSASHSFTVTPKVGISITENSGTDNNNMYSNATGISTGLSFRYHFSKHFALQSELLYEQKGYMLKGESNSLFKYTPGTYYSLDNKVDLGYVTIPLLLNMSFGENFKVYFNAGFYAAMRMNARCTGIAYTTNTNETVYQVNKITVYDDIDGYMKSDDWGWILGGGFQYPVLDKYRLDFEYRYASGSSNLFKNINNYEPADNEDVDIRNKALTFSLGFQIPIN